MIVKDFIEKLQQVDQNEEVIVSSPSRGCFEKAEIDDKHSLYDKKVVIFLLY